MDRMPGACEGAAREVLDLCVAVNPIEEVLIETVAESKESSKYCFTGMAERWSRC